jgi:hypothetical protein
MSYVGISARRARDAVLVAVAVTTGAVAPPLRAQGSDISVSAGTHVSTDSPTAPFVETFLAINPRDRNNLVAASMVGTDASMVTRVYASRDGGHTWQRGRAVGAGNTIFANGGDPVVYFDATGTALFGVYHNAPLGFLISRSEDGGFTWQSPLTVRDGVYDRPYMALDNTGGKFDGRIYAAGAIEITDVSGKRHLSIALNVSTDRGRTFSSGRIITGEWSTDESIGVCDLLVTPDGKLVVPIDTYFFPPRDSLHSARFSTMISDDGGATFGPSQAGPARAEGTGFRSLKSLGASRAAIDLSDGPYRGRLYLLWTDFDGTKYMVKLAHSSDVGKTWSEPVVVNDNVSQGDPANPALAVSKDGVVGVVFNDRRDDPENSCFRLYFAASVDGGETFLPNVRASERPTCPQAPGNRISRATVMAPGFTISGPPRQAIVIDDDEIGGRWPNGGDTQGLVAGPDGVFHSAWINGESGVMQLWSKEITLDKTATLRSSATPQPRRDLSRDLTLEVSQPSINIATHTVSVRARLRNSLPVTIDGPFTIVLEDIAGALKDLRALNADNGRPGKGAAWEFPPSGNTSLRSQQESAAKVLRWEFSGTPTRENRVPFVAYFSILGPPLR